MKEIRAVRSLGHSCLFTSGPVMGNMIEFLLREREKGNFSVRGSRMDAGRGVSDFEMLLLRYILCAPGFVNVNPVLTHVHPTSSVSMYADGNNRLMQRNKKPSDD